MAHFDSPGSFAPGPAHGATSSADVSTFETSLGTSVGKMEEQMRRIEKQETRIREFEKRLDARETRTTEILIVFIALFAFLSVNINIFTRLNNIYSAIWFMLLMTICSLLLVGTLFLFIHQRGKWYELLLVLGFLIAITALLVVPHVGLLNNQLNPS